MEIPSIPDASTEMDAMQELIEGNSMEAMPIEPMSD